MKREPARYSAYTVESVIDGTVMAEIDGQYVPARPLGGGHSRFYLAWLVFTGRADVLHWPGQE